MVYDRRGECSRNPRRVGIVTIDTGALRDRLLADALAADLCIPGRFLASSAKVAWGDLDSHVRERAEGHRKDLLLSPASMEVPFDRAREKWCAMTSFGADSHRSRGADDPPRRGVSRLVSGARHLLRADGREMVLKVDRKEPGREILRWRFVSLALPPGILVAAASKPGRTPPERVRILHPSIAPDDPVAHQHVHHAAMMSFEELWVTLRRRALVQPSELESSLRDKRALCPGLHRGACLGVPSANEPEYAKIRPLARDRHMSEWGGLLRQAFIAGRLLDFHAGHYKSLACCKQEECTTARPWLRTFIAGRTRSYPGSSFRYPWPGDLFRAETRYRREVEQISSPHGAEGPAVWLRKEMAEESRRLVRAFSHLRPEESTTDDEEFEALLLQYLRVKVALFRLLVHPPGERGLEPFLHHFQQIKVYAPEADSVNPPAPDEPGLRVHATEYRVAPDAWFKTFRLRGGEIEGTTKIDDQRESAWLVHFKRTRRNDGLPLFDGGIQEMDSDADDIMRALNAKPTLLRTLRGIDICGVEEHQPLWVSADTLRRVRLHSRSIAGRRPSLGLEPLRLTFHVGEDFRSLTSGMRAVAEPFHWNLIERGDRIGHGLALTLEPASWFRRHRGEVLSVKRFDRLLDLAFLAEYAKDKNDSQRKWLEKQIVDTVRSLGFESESSIRKSDYKEIVKATRNLWKSLGCRSTRRMLTNDRYCGNARHERWIHCYLWNRSFWKRAEQVVRMPVLVDEIGKMSNDEKIAAENLRNERELLKKAHRTLLQEVARWQVCIESNPSSNLVVGSLDGIAAQDFLARRPTKEIQKDGETLTWTINTDDPITFSTTLADEYAYAWAGMTMRANNPCDPSYARALLDESAATSMRTRFTVPVNDKPGKRGNKRRTRNA